MSYIKAINKDLIKKIAAGEVIERPESIIKELVENSIDAESTKIEIIIKEGGIDSIIVKDNGIGINKDEIDLAFKRYTSSKIFSIDDLDNINTLGGAVSAIEQEYQQNEIATSAYEYQKGIDNQRNIIVGVNKFQNHINDNSNNEILHLSEKSANNQIKRLKEFKEARNNENVSRKLQELYEASKQSTNLMPYIISAVKSSATLGEISDILRKSFGIHS